MMICVLLVTIAAAVAFMRIGGVKHRVYASLAHCYVGFLFGAGWGIPSPVFLRTAWALTAVEVVMFAYDHVYLKRFLHVGESGREGDPLHATSWRLWGMKPSSGREARFLAGDPVEAPREPGRTDRGGGGSHGPEA